MGLESAPCSSLPKFLYIMFESISDDLFKYFRDDFFEFVFNNTYHTIATTVSEICGGIIKRDPKSFKKNARILIEKLRTKSMKTKQEGTKVVLISFHVIKHFSGNITILNEIVGNAGNQIMTCRLRSMSCRTFNGKSQESIGFPCCLVLQTVTKSK